MRNPLRTLFDKLTYRNEYTNPDPADGLSISGYRFDSTRDTFRLGRTVRHEDLPAYLHARRRRILHEGLDPVDTALLDPATVRLLLDSTDIDPDSSGRRLHRAVDRRAPASTAGIR